MPTLHVPAGFCGDRSVGAESAVGRRYVLDTHACVFMLAAPRKLGREARGAIGRVEVGRDQAWLPAAVVAEVLILRDLGRVRIGLPELKRAFEGAPGFHFLPLDLPQLDQFASLAAVRDPFDRLIVGAARALGATLITRDSALEEVGLVETVWS